MAKKEFANGFRGGSALILAVVLTSLLAVIGTIFLMTARVDRMSTSAISENRDLNAAVEAAIAKISHKLAMDVPGMPEGDEYYDYPGDKDRWLASLEPYKDGGTYKWGQISDISDYIDNSEQKDVNAGIVNDHETIGLDLNGKADSDEVADADGDGVADSKWIELEGMTSSKGETIYAAIRVIDNGGMLNVNTGYQFDPNNPGMDGKYIDGSDQMQINLLGLSKRSLSNTTDQLNEERFGSPSPSYDMEAYLRDVVWRYNRPDGNYTPFDISDELELRNRFTLNRTDIDSRIEEVWTSAFKSGDGNYLYTPVDDPCAFSDWKKEVYYDYDSSDPNAARDDYSYRHIGTIYNMDRIIDPAGGKMLNINAAGDVNAIYQTVKSGLLRDNPTFPDADETAAQIAVNLVDFRDADSEVSFIEVNDVNGASGTYYGFETPCIYISELAHKFRQLMPPGGIGDPCDLVYYRSYAIELYKPYEEDAYPESGDWRLNIDPCDPCAPYSRIVNIDWSGNKRFHVILFEDLIDPNMEMSGEVYFDANDADPNDPSIDDTSQEEDKPSGDIVFDANDEIILERWVEDANQWVAVDSVTVPAASGGWLSYDVNPHSIQRDISLHKCIRRLWDPGESIPVTLGRDNNYATGDSICIQSHPENEDFRNVGEIGKLFRKDVYETGSMSWTWTDTATERDVRLDLADPNYHRLFQYLTVMDPTNDDIDNDGDGVGLGGEIDPSELKVPGRININTAPWFVVRQLPWMQPEIAQAIVAYRDKLNIDPNDPNVPNGPDYKNNTRQQETGIDGLREEEGFASIGELATVINTSDYDDYSMHYYALPSGQPGDLDDYPDLTSGDDPNAGDGAPDDFEEQDVIFSRISDLVTVRSDVFSAYVLVRIGVDGPQKRAMAILDRSNVYPSGGRVRVIAVQPASDPR